MKNMESAVAHELMIKKDLFDRTKSLKVGYMNLKSIPIPSNLIENQNEKLEWKLYETRNVSFIVTQLQHIYAFGNNEYGQLGIESATKIRTPTRVKLNLKQDEEIKFIVSAYGSTFISTTLNRIFATGDNNEGQLGISSKQKSIYTPTEVKLNLNNNEVVKSILIDNYSTFITTTENRIYVSGLNDRGQLGINSEEPMIYTPIELKLSLFKDEEIKSIFCIWGSTFISTPSRIFAAGLNDEGQLGIYSEEPNSLTVREVYLSLEEDEAIESITSNYCSTNISTTTSRKLCCGIWRFDE